MPHLGSKDELTRPIKLVRRVFLRSMAHQQTVDNFVRKIVHAFLLAEYNFLYKTKKTCFQ